MKVAKTLILLLALLTPMAAGAGADDQGDAAQTVDTLRLQLLETEAKEAELESRAKQLDEDLKPENIARALAGIGSTRPEELRETRRRQLTIERDGVSAQLKLVATSRERLQAAIKTAEGQAYLQSAENATRNQATLSGGLFAVKGLLILAAVAALSLVLVLALIRRRAQV
jgi:hypothetical protein